MPDKNRCRTCGQAKKELQGEANSRRRICSTCRRKTRRATARRLHVQQTYGLTPADHDTILAHQGGACAITGKRMPYPLHVDHDHATGLVRGLLSKQANKLLRDVRDDVSVLRAAIEYLENPPAARLGIVAKAPTASEGPHD